MLKIITIASWEPRFYSGLSRYLPSVEFDSLLTFFFDEYADRSLEYRRLLDSNYSGRYIEKELSFSDSLGAWKVMAETIEEHISLNDRVVFDITTAPRDILFSILYILRIRMCDVEFIYHRPNSYGDWLSRDSEKPELILKMSGVFSLNKPTLLLFLPGYDPERMQQLLMRHEPQKIILGLQEGEQYDSVTRCRKSSKATVNNLNLVAEYFDYNAYSEDQGFASIKEAITPYFEDYNVLASTLGPKPSSIALFHLHQYNQKIGLVYVKSKEYNEKYSDGFSERLSGKVFLNTVDYKCEEQCKI